MPRSSRRAPVVSASPEVSSDDDAPGAPGSVMDEDGPEYNDLTVPLRGATTDEDDDMETDTVTPARRAKSFSKKRRASNVFGEGAGGSGGSSPTSRGGAKRRTSMFFEVDEEAEREEKRRRRKSTRQSMAAGLQDQGDDATGDNTGEPSGTTGGGGAPERPTMRAPRISGRINAVVPNAPPPVLSMDVMTSNFEEWMKMATDNKINAANSWNFALIDYFHDMSLLRNTDDNSINFQKASFTLDGCVKIWTSRVDSVGTETGKLLSNLAQENAQDGDGEHEGEDGESGEGEEGDKGKKKRVVHRTEATLAKSYSQLQTKKLDLEFTVDPLFRKTRAEFDEGGAMGLLMNHLSVDSKMRIVFDSGDTKILDDDEDEPEEHQTIDLSDLKANFIPSLETLNDRSIAQSLSDFRFSSNPADLDFTFANRTQDDPDAPDFGDVGDFPNLGGADDDDDDHGDNGFGFGGGEAGDFFTGDQAIGDGMPSGPAGYGMDGDEDNSGEGPVIGMEPFDPRRAPNEKDLVMALNMNENEDEILDYFDSTFMKNWAGPEHWKLRRPVKKPEAAAGETSAPRARRTKESFQIDFLNPAPPEQTAKQLFVPASKTSTISLPPKVGATTAASASATSKGRKKKGVAVKRDDHLLPDDMHFSSQQLLRLFLKPKFTLKMRRHGIQLRLANEAGDGEVDANYWAQQANQSSGLDVDQTQGGGPIPFNTQFFHDDYDDDVGGGGYDVDDDMMPVDAIPAALDAEEGDLLAATQEPLKRVRAEFVNYARKAKRVDVRKLKENIWKGLEIITEKPTLGDDTEDVSSLTDPSQPRKFDTVIQRLRKSYTRDKMEEISTSFCFICLLHLANEQGLKIEVGRDGDTGDTIIPDDDDEDGEDGGNDDANVMEKNVGDIWGIKVYRDPAAGVVA